MAKETAAATTLLHVATHPIRYKIVKLLEKKQPLYIAQIVDGLGKAGESGNVDRKLVSFHLMTLEKYGLIDSDLRTVESSAGNPVAARYFTLTEAGRKVLSQIKL